MTLLQIWKENPEQILAKRVGQIIGFEAMASLETRTRRPLNFAIFWLEFQVIFLAGTLMIALKVHSRTPVWHFRILSTK
jgi:hypothetical protein